jgi:hypothetical protein
VVFFYCKHGDARFNTFVALARRMLTQLLGQCPDLLPYYHDKVLASNEAVLTSLPLAKEILETALKSASKTYVIIDGLDECHRDERKSISSWFRQVVEDLPLTDVDQIRCLFISQDDGYARKDFSVLPSLKITSADTVPDIEAYTSKRASEVQQKFALSDSRRSEIIRKVTDGSQGM